jgi:hypothetical protein
VSDYEKLMLKQAKEDLRVLSGKMEFMRKQIVAMEQQVGVALAELGVLSVK